jgi:hypothetical protein
VTLRKSTWKQSCCFSRQVPDSVRQKLLIAKQGCMKLITIYISYAKSQKKLKKQPDRLHKANNLIFPNRMSILQSKPSGKQQCLDVSCSDFRKGVQLPAPPGPPNVSTTSCRSLLPLACSDLTAFPGNPCRPR